MINQPIEIAVIDDGVNEHLYNIKELNNSIEIDEQLLVKESMTINKNTISHGTICAAIIKLYAPQSSISSIKILNSCNKRGEKNQLIKALYWCLENGIKIVNLSAGTIDFRDFNEIKRCVNEVTKKGLIIIAACNNRNIYTVPASLTSVIGVQCGMKYENGQYKFNKYALDGIDVTASGKHYLQSQSGEYNCTNASNSYAAPLITAMVYNILANNPELALEGIRTELYKMALNFEGNNYNPYMYLNTDWINRKAFSSSNYNSTLIQEDMKIWDYKFYKEYLQKKVKDIEMNIEIPIIAIFNCSDSGLLLNLNDMFRSDGYYSMIVSTEISDIFDGNEYLPTQISVKRFLAYIYRKYNCDIILLNVGDSILLEEIKKDALFDIEIFFKSEKGRRPVYKKKSVGSDDFVSIEINYDYCEKKLLKVFKKIKKLLRG